MNETKTLRVYHIINPPNNPTYYKVSNIEEAVKKINELVQEDLEDPQVGINILGLEEDTEIMNGGWTEWYDEGGFDILSVMDGESEYYDENGVEKS